MVIFQVANSRDCAEAAVTVPNEGACAESLQPIIRPFGTDRESLLVQKTRATTALSQITFSGRLGQKKNK